MSTGRALILERAFAEEAEQLLAELSTLAKSNGLDFTGPEGPWLAGQSVVLARNSAKLEFQAKRPEELGWAQGRDHVWGLVIKKENVGGAGQVSVIRTLDCWRAQNPETLAQALRKNSVTYTPLTESDGWVLVSNIVEWVREQVKIFFGGNHA
jgi:hypothetical protein